MDSSKSFHLPSKWHSLNKEQFDKVRIEFEDQRQIHKLALSYMSINEQTKLLDFPNFTASEELIYCEQKPPGFSLALMDQRTLERLLVSITELLEDSESICLTSDTIKKQESWLYHWIYGTLAAIHKPLEPSVHSSLRNIARFAIKRRNKLKPNEFERSLPLTLIISVIAYNFNQLDLADKS